VPRRGVDLVASIEEAFGGLDRPSPEEISGYYTYADQDFLDAFGQRTWQELRPLSQYIRGAGDLLVLSAKVYQYCLPAYLVALVDEAGEDSYLSGVLKSLWYEVEHRDSRLLRDHFDPRKGMAETLNELEIQMPELTDQERMKAAEIRAGIAQKIAYIKELRGVDLLDSYQWQARLRAKWEERMPLLTGLQKNCIARVLVLILERTTDPFGRRRIQTLLDKYWRAFLAA